MTGDPLEQAADPDLASHAVAAVRIDRDRVAVVCSCGAETGEHPTEQEARAEWDEHVEEVG